MPSKRQRATRQAEELDRLNDSIQSTPATPATTSVNMESLLETLTAAITTNQRTPTAKPFKTPQFNGTGDIDQYISQFQEVSAANRWTESEARLHLKLSLSDTATSCGEGKTTKEIFQNLQARFGLSIRQAKEKLRSIKGNNHELPKLGSEISALIKLAYPNLDQQDQTDMALDTFSRALDSVSLQRHFLATKPDTLRQAVQSAEEFFQLEKSSRQAKLNNITETNIDNTRIQELAQQQETLQKLILQQQEQQQQILQQLQEMQRTRFITPQFQPFPQQDFPPRAPAHRPPLACYECQGPHLRRNCPKLHNKTNKPTGNLQGPAQ